MYFMCVPPWVNRTTRVGIDTTPIKYLPSAMPQGAQDTAAAVEIVYRSDWGRIVAALIRLLGDFDLA